MLSVLAVAFGSAAGGVARWLLSGAVQRWYGADVLPSGRAVLPVGTLLVNVTGSFLLGALIVAMPRGAPGDASAWRLLLTVGFCGGYTTFSTFSYDTIALAEGGSASLAAANVLLSLTAALGATLAGMWIMRVLLARSVG